MTEPVDLQRWVRSGPLSRPGLRQDRRPVTPLTSQNQPPRRSAERAVQIREGLDRISRGLRMFQEVQAERRSHFPSLAANLRAIADAAQHPLASDKRLIRAPSGAYEGDGTAGGFLVEPQYAAKLIGSMYGEGGALLASLCNITTTTAPLAEWKIPGVDETSRRNGSRFGGVTSYWATEAEQVSPSLPKFRNIALSPKKIIGVVYGSNELMADPVIFENYLQQAFGAELGFKLDWSVLFGTGAGQPLGIINSPATITVAKESGQASATVVRANVEKMWSRLPLSSRRTAVWVVSEDVEQQLAQLTRIMHEGWRE